MAQLGPVGSSAQYNAHSPCSVKSTVGGSRRRRADRHLEVVLASVKMVPGRKERGIRSAAWGWYTAGPVTADAMLSGYYWKRRKQGSCRQMDFVAWLASSQQLNYLRPRRQFRRGGKGHEIRQAREGIKEDTYAAMRGNWQGVHNQALQRLPPLLLSDSAALFTPHKRALQLLCQAALPFGCGGPAAMPLQLLLLLLLTASRIS